MTFRWLASREFGGTAKGCAAVIDVEAGGGYVPHRFVGLERALYVVSGGGRHVGSGGETSLTAGQAVYLNRDQWHGFDASAPTRLITLYAPDASTLAHEYESGAADAQDDGPVLVMDPEDVDEMPGLSEDLGFHGMTIKLLISQENSASDQFQMGVTWFEEGGAHVLHKHDNAEELLYFIEGESAQQLGEGHTWAAKPGDLSYCSCGEWHGHRILGRRGFYLFSYIGAGTGLAAGYTLHDPVAQANLEAYMAELAAGLEAS